MAELAPVSCLPPELLTNTFQFLPFDDLKNVLLVCRLGQYTITHQEYRWNISK